jgi:hypothetical protein
MDIVSTIRSIVEIGQQIKKAYEARKEVEGKCGDIYKLIDTMAPVLQAVNAMRLPKNKMQTFVKSLSALAETMKEARTFAMDYLKCSVGSGAAIGLLNLGNQMLSAEDDLKVRVKAVPAQHHVLLRYVSLCACRTLKTSKPNFKHHGTFSTTA